MPGGGVDMSDLSVSVSVLLGIVASSEVARRTASYLLSNRDWTVCVLEFISTFQLCACTHELKLLAEVGGLEPRIALTCTYVISVVHALSFRDAICNPCGVVERLCRGTLTRRGALARISLQLIAAVLASAVMPRAWSLSLSDLHVQHKLMGFKCTTSPISGPLLQAAAVELSCAFVMHAAVSNLHSVDEMFRVHAIAAVITALVYAGGHITGAVFNPALAFSIQFPCPGNTFAEYSFVYWLGPILGVTASLLVFEKVIPAFFGKGTKSNRLKMKMK